MQNRKLPVHGLIIGSSLSLNLAVIIRIVAYTLVNCRAERRTNKKTGKKFEYDYVHVNERVISWMILSLFIYVRARACVCVYVYVYLLSHSHSFFLSKHS